MNQENKYKTFVFRYMRIGKPQEQMTLTIIADNKEEATVKFWDRVIPNQYEIIATTYFNKDESGIDILCVDNPNNKFILNFEDEEAKKEETFDLSFLQGEYTVDQARLLIDQIKVIIGDDCDHFWVRTTKNYKRAWKCTECGEISLKKPIKKRK